MEDGFRIGAQRQRCFFWEKFVPWMMKNKYDETVSHRVHVTGGDCSRVRSRFPECRRYARRMVWFSSRATQRLHRQRRIPNDHFGVTVDHKYKIMHVTRAHPGTTDDSLVTLEDDFTRKPWRVTCTRILSLRCMTRTVRTSNKGRTRCATVDTAPRGFLYVRSRTWSDCPKFDWYRWIGSIRKD